MRREYLQILILYFGSTTKLEGCFKRTMSPNTLTELVLKWMKQANIMRVDWRFRSLSLNLIKNVWIVGPCQENQFK